MKAIVGNSLFALTMIIKREPIHHVVQWVNSHKKDYLLDKPLPWITFDAIDYLQNNLPKDISVFEYGSGGSTLFWLKWAKEIISIEHDETWYNHMKKRISGNPIIDYRLILPEKVDKLSDFADPSDPRQYISSDSRYSSYSFKNYVRSIDAFPEKYFDLVLIDGRARPSCMLHCIPKIKTGGILVLDNADRPYYLKKTKESLKGFTLLEFFGYLPMSKEQCQTSIYVLDEG